MLPIGSIVYLNEGTSKMMIIGRGPIINNDGVDNMFDYSACVYPQGFHPEKTYFFNEENIDEVVFEGYRDTEEDRFQKLYKEKEEKEGNSIKKGEVAESLKESPDASLANRE